MVQSPGVRQLWPLCARLLVWDFPKSPVLGLSSSLSSKALLHGGDKAVDNSWRNVASWSFNFRRGSSFASGYSALTRKTLDSIIKVERVKHVSSDELTTIWNEYHIGRGHISAVMGSELFNAFQQRASACPLFVIPVRRGLGYITLLMQAQMPHLLFTGIGDYRARGSDATPYLTVTHYTEFAETKGLVLVRGDVALTSKLSDAEARTALEVAHSFFLNNSRYRIVTKFNKDSKEFDFREVLKELNMSVGP